MKLKRKNAGMTLVEVLVSITILSMASVTMLFLVSKSMSGWSSGTSADAATSDVTIALQKMSKDIRDARSATVISGTLVVAFPRVLVDQTTGERVYDTSGSSTVTRTYFVRDGNLVRNVSGIVTTVSRGVSSAVFGASGGTVSVTLRSSQQTGSRQETREIYGRINLRNYRSNQ